MYTKRKSKKHRIRPHLEWGIPTFCVQKEDSMKKIILLIIVGLFVSGCAMDHMAKPPKETKQVQHIPGSVFQVTENGFYTTELVLKPKNPVVGKSKGHLIIHDYKAVDTPGLDITATLYMPETGAVSKETPTFKDKERGLYIVDNIYFNEPGKWELKMDIKGQKFSDTVVLQLPEVKEKTGSEPEETESPIDKLLKGK
jgi:uncharacterized protein YceK